MSDSSPSSWAWPECLSAVLFFYRPPLWAQCGHGTDSGRFPGARLASSALSLEPVFIFTRRLNAVIIINSPLGLCVPQSQKVVRPSSFHPPDRKTTHCPGWGRGQRCLILSRWMWSGEADGLAPVPPPPLSPFPASSRSFTSSLLLLCVSGLLPGAQASPAGQGLSSRTGLLCSRAVLGMLSL